MTTDNKTLAVDVLAVIMESADFMREDGYTHRAIPLEEAHAALAEMIESCDHLKRDATNERWAAFHAALARVKGESA
ncbi:hypothetical protein [Stenotrophomonas maltophilia]|uniref:hypothetical protein n=1 Tax=Stenotrophomonas TaxID=40323 RepID=UPI000659AFB5|nr:hypothetical protein [Stenotrophomonas maltophilia]CRQ56855.1 hypothetical protein PAERUG_E15_London_28_01_14_04147 [Pseudomonas aeruginosa]